MPNEKEAIPEEIRKEFQTDADGNILFFSQPPTKILVKDELLPKLSLRFRAARLRRRIQEDAMKEEDNQQQTDVQLEERAAKRQKAQTVEENPALDRQTAMQFWRDWMADVEKGTIEMYKADFGDRWQTVKAFNDAKLAKDLKAAASKMDNLKDTQDEKAKRWQAERQMLLGNKIFKDDFDPRF